MNTSSIYSKTAKGMAELRHGAKSLSKLQAWALNMVDGKSSVESLTFMLDEASARRFIEALPELEKLELIRVFIDIDQELVEQQLSVPAARGASSASALPALEVIELPPEQSVQAWAEAKRGARALEETGYYAAKKALPRTSDGKKAAVKVLVVEDDDVIAQMLEFLLRENGFYVKRAADSATAFIELERRPLPDVVLLDVMLPGKDGFEILKQIRGDAGLRDMPVIMVTSQISDKYVMRGLKEGADGYIFKPFKWETLYGCIKNVCGL